MATDPQARADIVKLTARVVALEKEVTILKDQDAFIKGLLNQMGNDLEEQRNTDAMHDGQIADLEERVGVLEGDHDHDYDYQPEPEPIPPDPGPDVPPPVASCTVVQLASPPYTIKAEALDQGPTATYAWKFGATNPDGTPGTGSGRVVQYTYPDGGTRHIDLTVTNAAGSDTHTHTMTLTDPVTVPPIPPDPTPIPPDPTKPDLFDLDLANVADERALWDKYNKPAGAVFPNFFEGDAIVGKNLLLTTDEKGAKVQRHIYDRRGLKCVNDVSCQVGTKLWGRQQEVYASYEFATSKNWLAYDEAQCPAQGDLVGDQKMFFFDTEQDMSGRFGGDLTHNNAQPGAPQGSLFQEGAPQSAVATGARPAKDGWAGYTFQPGVRYRIDKHFKCSTTSSSNDGINEEWITNLSTGVRTKVWDDRGFSVCAAPDATKPEYINSMSICHNQSSGRHDQAMYVDFYDLKAWSKNNPPSWATQK